MKKRYDAKFYTIYSCTGEVNGKRIHVQFDKAYARGTTAFYVTTNEEEQELIESMPEYTHNEIVATIINEEDKATKTEKTETKQKEAKNRKYKNKADLYMQITALLPNVEINKSMTINELIDIAKANNISFKEDK